MADLPVDRAALVAELERLERAYLAMGQGLDAEAWNRQPSPGSSWSVGQCLDHVAKINRPYLGALREAANRAPRGTAALRANVLGRWFVAEMEPPVKRRWPVPEVAVPASDLEPRATVESFRQTQAEVIRLIRETAELDLNRVRFRNPYLKGLRVFNVATGLLVIAAHERRHLVQAEKIRAAVV